MSSSLHSTIQLQCVCVCVCVFAERWEVVLDEPLNNLLSALNATVNIFKKALFFLILKVSCQPAKASPLTPSLSLPPSLSLSLPPSQETYSLLQDRIPLGLKSYLHRHDIVFSQAVTVTVTSFVFKLLQSFAISSFLNQLEQVQHWPHPPLWGVVCF